MPKILNNTQIKYLATFFMLLDHLALILIPNSTVIYIIFRSIGRLAAPLFFLAIAEGAFHTRNIYKYLYKILVLGTIFQLVYMAFSGDKINLINLLMSYKNIFITLALGLGGIIAIKKSNGSKLLQFFSAILFSSLGFVLNVDYSWYGVMMIILFYLLRNKSLKLTFATIFLNLLFFLSKLNNGPIFWNAIQLLAILSLIVIFIYNGQRGKGSKYFFYIFYPVHLIILYVLSYFL